MNLDFSFYFAVFLRRLHVFVIISALTTAASLAAAFLLPATYTAQSRLLVESSQIPGPLAAPTVQTQPLEKLQTLQQQLMTRANLLDIAKRLNVFKDSAKMSPDDIVQAMRNQTNINNAAGRGQATFMTISFDAETGPAAAGVVNEYVTLILSADVKSRTDSAEQTLDFFRDEVKDLGVKLDQLSSKILDFQNKNSDALPNTLTFRLSQQTALQTQLSTADRDISQLKDQKTRLIAIFNSTGQVNPVPGVTQTPEAKQLATLKDQLTQSLSTLSPTNPNIRLLQQKIAGLEEVVKNQVAAAPTTQPGAVQVSSATSMLDVQIADIDTRIAVLEDQRKQFEEQLAVLKDTIDRTPANQIALDALNRDYSNIQTQYNTAVSRLSQASAAERIEYKSAGERITVLDAATVPNRPAKPNRILIAAGGLFAGIAFGIAAIVLLELLNRSVRRPKDLINAFGITPISTIPYMRTPSEVMMRRSGFVMLLLLAVVGIPALIYSVHVYYQPLDLIMARVAAKFGIRL
jgi:polysaccharide chain length determinant protein (PEP-CTERM system associated)